MERLVEERRCLNKSKAHSPTLLPASVPRASARKRTREMCSVSVLCSSLLGRIPTCQYQQRLCVAFWTFVWTYFWACQCAAIILWLSFVVLMRTSWVNLLYANDRLLWPTVQSQIITCPPYSMPYPTPGTWTDDHVLIDNILQKHWKQNFAFPR